MKFLLLFPFKTILYKIKIEKHLNKYFFFMVFKIYFVRIKNFIIIWNHKYGNFHVRAWVVGVFCSVRFLKNYLVYCIYIVRVVFVSIKFIRLYLVDKLPKFFMVINVYSHII